MTSPPGCMSTPQLIPLPWDSAHFGFRVARLTPPILDEHELIGALRAAQRDQVHLIYWDSATSSPAPQPILEEFGGLLVNGRVTYAANLAECPPPAGLAAATEFTVREFAQGEATPDLLELAVEAGASSRFCVDRQIERGKFEDLYRIWMQRSTRGELADAVLIAVRPAPGCPLTAGMITLKCTPAGGQIGLLATRAASRGRGVGRQLLAAAHDWFQQRGVMRSVVVTQRENGSACRLYERNGYTLACAESSHHFWLQRGVAPT